MKKSKTVSLIFMLFFALVSAMLFPALSKKTNFNFTQKIETHFSDSGKDKQWFTQDDVIGSFPFITITKTNLDKSKITDLRILDFGIDKQWFTNDDKTEISHTAFNAKGKITQRTRCFGDYADAQKNPQIKNASCDIMTTFQYNDNKSISMFRVSQLGADNILDTQDDVIQSELQIFKTNNEKVKKELGFVCKKNKCTRENFQANSKLVTCVYYYYNKHTVVERQMPITKDSQGNAFCKNEPNIDFKKLKINLTNDLATDLTIKTKPSVNVAHGQTKNYFLVNDYKGKPIVTKRIYSVYDNDNNILLNAEYYESGADNIWNTPDDDLWYYDKKEYTQIGKQKLQSKISTLRRRDAIAKQLPNRKYTFKDKRVLTLNDKPVEYSTFSYDNQGRLKKAVHYKITEKKNPSWHISGYSNYEYE